MNIGLPKIDITYKGLGTSAIQRGKRGIAVLVIRDDTDKTFTSAEYFSIEDINKTEISKYTPENVQFIKDVLEGMPSKVLVFRVDVAGELATILSEMKASIPMNCWIGIVSAVTDDHSALSTWVKASVLNDKKCYKAIVYKALGDDTSVVNFTNVKVTFNDDRNEKTGDEAIPYLIGYLAGIPLTMSAIAKALTKFKSVIEPTDLEAAVNNAEFVLYNDESEVYVARGVNSLKTAGADKTDEMKFIHVKEIMDLIYTDFYVAWKKNYKGKYPNTLDNQMLLIGALNAYLKSLKGILDNQFDNRVYIDVATQRLANEVKYGKAEVNTWSDEKMLQMTVSTSVFLSARIKILGITEDIFLKIFM